MTKTLSQQVYDMEQELRTLQYENENLKRMIYRLISFNGNEYDKSDYSEAKDKEILQCEFNFSSPGINVFRSWANPLIKPNNSESEL